MVFGFSWLVGKVMIDLLGNVSEKLLSSGDCWVATTHTL
jgi:hypothetical protein